MWTHKRHTPVKVLFGADDGLEVVIDGENRRAHPVRVVLVEEVSDLVGQVVQRMVFGQQKVPVQLRLDALIQVGPLVDLVVGIKEPLLVARHRKRARLAELFHQLPANGRFAAIRHGQRGSSAQNNQPIAE